jgi:hypothetical protein
LTFCLKIYDEGGVGIFKSLARHRAKKENEKRQVCLESPEKPKETQEIVEEISPQPKGALRTNGKWAWEDNGQSREEDLVPEDWCCIDRSPIPGKKTQEVGRVFPRYVNWGQPNHKSLYQRDYLNHSVVSASKQANVNPWSGFSSHEPMELTTTNRVKENAA